jgi:hypothetical protein
MKRIEWAVRNILTRKLVMICDTEAEAVEMAAAVNKSAEDELCEVVKVVTTIEVIERS